MKELSITPEPIHEYCKNHSSQPSETLLELIPATQAHSAHVAHMQVGHLEGKFLSILAKMIQAKTALEFGTFTGYSTLSIAEGLPENGKITTLDRDPKATELAKVFWKKSSHGKKIELILGDAAITTEKLKDQIHAGERPYFDLVFIDADKSSYERYYESALQILRQGGVMVVDNVLWSGRVLDPQDSSDRIINSFNKKISNDFRVEKVMLPVRDGITLIFKK